MALYSAYQGGKSTFPIYTSITATTPSAYQHFLTLGLKVLRLGGDNSNIPIYTRQAATATSAYSKIPIYDLKTLQLGQDGLLVYDMKNFGKPFP